MKTTKNRTRFLSLAILGIACFSVGLGAADAGDKRPEIRTGFVDILNVKNIPAAAEDWSAFCLSDMGSWQGFALPSENVPSSYAGFPGPFLMTRGRWLSPALFQFQISDSSTDQPIDFAKSTSRKIVYYPGLLSQEYSVDGLRVVLRLIFISSRSVLVSAEVTNESSVVRNIRAGWRGSLFLDSASLAADGNAIGISFDRRKETSRIVFGDDLSARITTQSPKDYQALAARPLAMEPSKKYLTCLVETFFLAGDNDKMRTDETALAGDALGRPETFFNQNSARWNGYLQRALQTKSVWSKDPEYRKIAVKALMTLINNWKCANGDLHHDGLFPSYAVDYFNGFWAWDSWKHAAALARFAPEIAKNQILAMFDYQDSSGMIADCVFADSQENNWRDTKPPLAAWAIREVYHQTHDLEFLKSIYPQLLKYHDWWYEHRDHDKNGLCEYGSTDGTRVAAAWESGMDNAIRFDDAVMVQNSDQGWSLSQESVDLNSYLYAEKLYLSELATALGKKEKAKKLLEDAGKLRKLIQDLMFDDEAGYFFDIRLDTKEKIKVEGPEGWIPLWAGAASQSQAEKVKRVVMSENKFNTLVPFPTVAIDHPKYTKGGYWRGPVWLDQAYFGVKGLINYGYHNEAEAMTRKLFDNPAGLKNSQDPIRENYDPQTGEGIKVNHFSWSAAHFLLLFRNE